MRITAEISLYPLAEGFVHDIREFILKLREQPGIEVRTNQVSTQIRGEFAAVTGAVNQCMADSMAQPGTRIFVVKYLNADLDIGSAPRIERDA
jgi:uncharacterized protein YqgV (UPF0045/DUF77 family)